jgi:hypothetical protein
LGVAPLKGRRRALRYNLFLRGELFANSKLYNNTAIILRKKSIFTSIANALGQAFFYFAQQL